MMNVSEHLVVIEMIIYMANRLGQEETFSTHTTISFSMRLNSMQKIFETPFGKCHYGLVSYHYYP